MCNRGLRVNHPPPSGVSASLPRHSLQHCGNAELQPGLCLTPSRRGQGSVRPSPLPSPTRPAVCCTCISDDDVFEEISVRHGPPRSPASAALKWLPSKTIKASSGAPRGCVCCSRTRVASALSLAVYPEPPRVSAPLRPFFSLRR